RPGRSLALGSFSFHRVLCIKMLFTSSKNGSQLGRGAHRISMGRLYLDAEARPVGNGDSAFFRSQAPCRVSIHEKLRAVERTGVAYPSPSVHVERGGKRKVGVGEAGAKE